MNETVLLTKDAFQKVIEDIVYIEEEKNSLINYSSKDPLDKKQLDQLFEKYINQVDKLIRNTQIQPDANNLLPFVIINSIVRCQNISTTNQIDYRIVQPFKDPNAYDIPFLSTTGTSLLLKNVGDIVTLNTPQGTIDNRIISIQLSF